MDDTNPNGIPSPRDGRLVRIRPDSPLNLRVQVEVDLDALWALTQVAVRTARGSRRDPMAKLARRALGRLPTALVQSARKAVR